MSWVKNVSGQFINVNHIVKLTYANNSGDWSIVAILSDSSTSTLNGIYASESDAVAGASKLVHGFDPSVLV